MKNGDYRLGMLPCIFPNMKQISKVNYDICPEIYFTLFIVCYIYSKFTVIERTLFFLIFEFLTLFALLYFIYFSRVTLTLY